MTRQGGALEGGGAHGANDPDLVGSSRGGGSSRHIDGSASEVARHALPESESARRLLLRDLLRAMQPEVVGVEVEDWLQECGPSGAAIRHSLASAGQDPRVQRNTPTRLSSLPQRDTVLEALRQRNMVASNVGRAILKVLITVTLHSKCVRGH